MVTVMGLGVRVGKRILGGKDKLALFVGGGLTVQSDPQNEWNETVLKAETLLSIL